MFHRRILSAAPSSSSGATARRYNYWKLNSSTLKNWIDLTCAGRVQAGGQQGRLPVVGDAQEQARHELRDDGQGTQVSKLQCCTIKILNLSGGGKDIFGGPSLCTIPHDWGNE